MGYDKPDVYFQPEAFGLVQLAEFDWDDEPYQFSIAVLWWRPESEQFLLGEDSGCSCPSPFENFTDLAELTPYNSLTSLKNDLRARAAGCRRESILRDDIDRMVTAAREKGMRL